MDENNYTFNAKDILVEAITGAVRKLVDYRKQVPTVYNSKKVPGNVWHIPLVRYRMDEYQNHPTQKPIALLERIIKASSNENDLVVDPFSVLSQLPMLPNNSKENLSELKSAKNI